MNAEQIRETLKKYSDIKRSDDKCQDVKVLVILGNLFNFNRDIIEGADHDIIYLPSCSDLSQTEISEEDIVNLCKLGVFYDDDTGIPAMFV